ncbi:hypothetical protein ACFDTO_16665 [Microbacteriaceae bacterium 4G12]
MAYNDYDRNRMDEEYAAEVAPTKIDLDRKETESTTGGAIAGFIALGLAILSFFTYPIFFGIVAVLLGMYASSRDAKTTGRIAIVLGAIAAILAIFFRVALASFILSLF